VIDAVRTDPARSLSLRVVESVQRGLSTRSFTKGRSVDDPEGSGPPEHGVHHCHGLVLDAYRRLVGLDQHAQPPVVAAAGA
jgi:choline monooxygenase